MFFLNLNTNTTLASDSLTTAIKSFSSKVLKKSRGDNSVNCSQCQHSEEELSSVYSAANKKHISLSVLTEEQANDIFTKLKNDEDISFKYQFEGCYARAHKMAIVMDDMGIVSGKAFLEGEFYVDTKLGAIGWTYHVASLILVKKNGKKIPMIIDPAFFDQPVSYEKWKALLVKKSQSKIKSEYFTKRFNYTPKASQADLIKYDEDDLLDMEEANRTNSRKYEMLKMTQQVNTKGEK